MVRLLVLPKLEIFGLRTLDFLGRETGLEMVLALVAEENVHVVGTGSTYIQGLKKKIIGSQLMQVLACLNKQTSSKSVQNPNTSLYYLHLNNTSHFFSLLKKVSASKIINIILLV